MTQPQQPERARSRKTPSQDPDNAAALADAPGGLDTTTPRGPVPPENQPGHHPEQEQDKPDLADFAAKLSGDRAEEGGTAGQGSNGQGAERAVGDERRPAQQSRSKLKDVALLPVRVSLAVVRDVRECVSGRRQAQQGR